MSTTQCPSCHASVRADASWCLQCHLDLRPKPKPVLVAAVQPDRPDVRDATATGRHARPAGWPCTPCGADNEFGSTACETCGSPFLVDLHSDVVPKLHLPVIGDISRLGKGATYGIAIGVGLLFALGLTIVLVVAGSVL